MLETGQRRTLLDGATDARYIPTGHLVYLRAGSLFAVPFGLKQLAVTGPPVPVLDSVGDRAQIGFADYAFSLAGNLVYRQVDPRRFETEVVWVDRKGVAIPLSETRRAYAEIRLSPDGRRVAATIGAGVPNMDIWICDLARNSWDRLTSGGWNISPIWAPDGKRIAFASNRNGGANVFWMPVDGGQPPEQLTRGNAWLFPASFSPDARTLLLETQTAETGLDISVLSLDGDRKIQPLLQTPSSEGDALFSPDGRWIAYESDQSGRAEVYVTAYPGPRGRWQISTDGGGAPRWSRDGRELFYYSSGEKLMVAAVETRPEFHAGLPRPLFEMPNVRGYDVSSDGKRFIVIRPTLRPDSAPPSLAVVLGWFDDVKRRTAAGKKLP
jgi:dipeptidyl aminopeptidase/acylaminoacyl peptidase